MIHVRLTLLSCDVKNSENFIKFCRIRVVNLLVCCCWGPVLSATLTVFGCNLCLILVHSPRFRIGRREEAFPNFILSHQIIWFMCQFSFLHNFLFSPLFSQSQKLGFKVWRWSMGVWKAIYETFGNQKCEYTQASASNFFIINGGGVEEHRHKLAIFRLRVIVVDVV